MFEKVKAKIQDKLYQQALQTYQDDLHCQSNPYLMWIKETEQVDKKEGTEASYPSLSVVYMEDCGEDFTLQNTKKEILIFISREGRLSEEAFQMITDYFHNHKDTDILYSDEDVWMQNELEDDKENDELEHRIAPWVKPMWSPETLFSYFYFGHIFAIRTTKLKDIKWAGTYDCMMNVYDFVLKATEKAGKVGHIERVLYHLYQKGNDPKKLEQKLMTSRNCIGADKEYDFIKEMALERRGIKARMVHDEEGYSFPVYALKPDTKISIIIPSKDNLAVLKNCIKSIVDRSTFHHFEIIVVDNGSNAQNRMTMESIKSEYGVQYLYEPMEFNFSRMCNMGVRKATGNLILLLNDDMEVIQSDWLERLAGAAMQRHVGAVGAKLYYPNSKLIQHVGITNTVDGPGHKLKQMDDTLCYYHGRNKLIYDSIGVTAACMMVRTDVYKKIGGFFEGLHVAYNDVDFCFRLCEAQMRNVQRNDVILYHHESLSRGDDMQDARKMARLKAEKEVLYQRHPKLYMQDPYCGRNMNAGFPEYQCRYVYGYEYADETNYQDYVVSGKKFPAEKDMNHAIMVVLEESGKETLRKAGSKQVPYYIFKGWAYVPQADNCRYSFTVALHNRFNHSVWEIPVTRRYRKDVAAILPDETNVELTGFVCWLYEGNIPKGEYEIWLTARDKCSRQRLYRNTLKTVVIEK